MKDNGFKNRNIFVLIFEILLIAVAVGGLTFATSTILGGSSTIVKFGEYNVDYVGSTEIIANDLEPISDSLVNYDTKDNVIRLEFSVRSVDTNENPETLIYDIMLSDINIDCSLLNKYTKWRLYKEKELIYSGNFSPSFDGNILTDNYRLTETQQKLPLSTDNYDNYVLIIWISETCDDLTSCERVDQTGILNSDISMKVFVALMGGTPILYERIPSMNNTCVNKPVLYDGMIPVYYDNDSWKIADSTNSDVDKSWYNYGESKWANAVFVSTDKYNESESGTVVSFEDILGYYVWIPRFKYKLWNNGIDYTDSYNAYENGIDIIFESGVNSSGNVKCVLDKCAYKENKYLTHPAFTENSRGFWVSKYEISEGSKFISNVESLKNKSLDEYRTLISDLGKTYKLDDSVESHVISNLEWGAILYLSHSKYGVCTEKTCGLIDYNNVTVSGYNQQDSTTGNIYGVNDMAGATLEYAVGEGTVGTGIYEVRINDSSTWYQGMHFPINNNYILRGGNGIFSTSDLGMNDVSTRSVLINK